MKKSKDDFIVMRKSSRLGIADEDDNGQVGAGMNLKFNGKRSGHLRQPVMERRKNSYTINPYSMSCP
jgi:hypothetical protein